MARSRLLSILLLYPLSRLFGLGVWVRNRMFDHGLLKTREFDIPIISVGNLAVGGTGKTPHVEYLVERLAPTHRIAVLSRGYKRSTSGFLIACPETRPDEIGDESYQIYSKYGHAVTVAVCKSRAEGIDKLRKAVPDLEMILLDDAFQHRYVKPWASVVLTEFNRPLFSDHLLPYGRLRETRSSLNRADIVVVTKCPPNMKPMQYRILEEKLNLFPFQKLYFSEFDYQGLRPVFEGISMQIPVLNTLAPGTNILAVSGVANPRPFLKHLRKSRAKVKLKRFSDHHNFSEPDMQRIVDEFDAIRSNEKFIVTTEKDAVRLRSNPYFPDRLKSQIFYLPIKVKFINSDDMEFSEAVLKTIHDSQLLK
ncbi:MAG: tetraacyldisaccharide 4'-kinase [Muribaculaceae bacterium]|nr:tetraacyldisaccharide 4'-kinase [Muribaculaceae bacterium]